MRTSIDIPETLYKDIQNLADKIGIPMSTLVTIAVIDAYEMYENGTLNFEKDATKKKSKKMRKLNITFDKQDVYDEIVEFAKTIEYSFKDFAIDVIRYQLEKFSAIHNSFNERDIIDRRIRHTKTDQYSKEVIAEHQTISLVDQYFRSKKDQYGYSEKAVKKYYLAQALEQTLEKRDNERGKFNQM